MRLGAGESLHDIMSSSRQVAEGVSTAGQSLLYFCHATALHTGVWSVPATTEQNWSYTLFQPEAAGPAAVKQLMLQCLFIVSNL